MPKDTDQKSSISNTKPEEDSIYAQYYVEEGECSDYEDEEQEYAYKCDFTKREPPSGNNTTSLLSNLFSSTPVPIQSSTKSDHSSQSKPVNIARPTFIEIPVADPLSESLKKNVEWEHAQSPLEKYRNSKKHNASSESLNDNFSKW